MLTPKEIAYEVTKALDSKSCKCNISLSKLVSQYWCKWCQDNSHKHWKHHIYRSKCSCVCNIEIEVYCNCNSSHGSHNDQAVI